MSLETTIKRLLTRTLLAASLLVTPAVAQQTTSRVTVDRQRAVNTALTRPRPDTRYIILHATDAAFKGSLNTLIRLREAHYLVNRDGHIYSIVDRNDYANHSGSSMWNGVRDISNHAVGIEIVGDGDGPFTNAQYTAVRGLVKELQRTYNVPDVAVLGHYQVACCRENPFQEAENARAHIGLHTPHRGGRREPALDWRRLGIQHRFDDPDVAAGRLYMNGELATWVATHQQHQRVPAVRRSFTIAPTNSAWAIAGDMYNERTTLYTFPDGSVHPGNTITNWEAIPSGTRVRLNAPTDAAAQRQPFIRTIHTGETAWDVAGSAFDDSTTLYILPDHSIKRGNQIDETTIPPGTLVAVGARGPYTITNRRSAWNIAGRTYNTDSVAYITRDSVLLGNTARNFERMPPGTVLLLRNP